MPTRTHEIGIRVVYPLDAGEIVLRTDLDWNRDVEPRSVSGDLNSFDFVVRTKRLFVYFKPVWRRNGDLLWSVGDNYLALGDAAEPLVLYPHFFEDSQSSACELRRIAGEGGSENHSFRVFCPPGYRENTLKRYPVLYMQDGQNLFCPDEAFGGEHWRVQETLTLLETMNAIDKVIVVGVYPDDRMVEYTSEGCETYGRFLVQALRPRIDREFRTLTGPENSAVMGSSLGGVVSFYLAWNWPEVFGMAACMSSTFGYRDELHERVHGERNPGIRLYLDSGWPSDNYEVTRDMRALLLQRGFREGSDLLYLAFPQALHNEHFWALRSHIPYQFFFGKKPAPASRDS